MSPAPPTLNPSQTVERIREIIVGRHLERLEGRVARLESFPVNFHPERSTSDYENRILITEAKVEALQEQIHRFDQTKEEFEEMALIQRQEAQRLAAQIQDSVREKAEKETPRAVQRLETKLGFWLTEWQRSLQVRLEERDTKLIERVGDEIGMLKDDIEERFAEMESRVPANVEERFERIAAAARSLAEIAESISKPALSKP
ncbi:hypothetical protein [Luteolibacter sp. AS25]|uniref:hypothetical protein n=1 Tax=Luteolibacter sp. AS25 TaxID=3135776 RepID=UPI00398AFFCB